MKNINQKELQSDNRYREVGCIEQISYMLQWWLQAKYDAIQHLFSHPSDKDLK